MVPFYDIIRSRRASTRGTYAECGEILGRKKWDNDIRFHIHEIQGEPVDFGEAVGVGDGEEVHPFGGRGLVVVVHPGG